jgi:hypothetical protein
MHTCAGARSGRVESPDERRVPIDQIGRDARPGCGEAARDVREARDGCCQAGRR